MELQEAEAVWKGRRGTHVGACGVVAGVVAGAVADVEAGVVAPCVLIGRVGA